jgi:hypothetical protein
MTAGFHRLGKWGSRASFSFNLSIRPFKESARSSRRTFCLSGSTDDLSPRSARVESGVLDGFYKPIGVGATFWSLSRSGTMDRMETSGKYMEAVAVRWPVSTGFCRRMSAILAVGLISAQVAVAANLFVSDSGANNSIGLYDSSTGAVVNASFVTGLHQPHGLVVAGGKIFVTNFAGATPGASGSTVSECDATTGAIIDPEFISGLSQPTAITESGGNLYIANLASQGWISEYSTSGASVQDPLISGLSFPIGVVTSGGHLYVLSNGGATGAGKIGEYNLDGSVVNAALVTGLNSPYAITVSSTGHLLVADIGTNTVGEYDGTTGALINAALVSGVGGPRGLATYGGDLFVANVGSDTVGEYNDTTGAAVNASLVSGRICWGVAIQPPVPPTFVLHPADANGDHDLSIDEIGPYITAYLNGTPWPTPAPPSQIDIGYVGRAITIYLQGEKYGNDPSQSPPLLWVPAP